MKLSELVYQCVKNVSFNDDTSFSFENFLEGNFDGDSDYATHINNAFFSINEAIARLSDLERIPYRIEECKVENSFVDLDKLTSKLPVKEVVNVAVLFSDGSYHKIPHRMFGLTKVFVSDNFNSLKKVFVEYKEDIPFFTKVDIKYENDEETFEIIDGSKDLKEYGITNSMCNYIIEYAVGKLLEPTSAELSVMHINRAESYFANIKPVAQSFSQQRVSTSFRVGE